MSNSAGIIERWVLNGQLRLDSPLAIGGGDDQYGGNCMIALKNRDGLPYIPATSLAGALRHRFYQEYAYNGTMNPEMVTDVCRYFWGGAYKDQNDRQSAVVFSDAAPAAGAGDGMPPYISVRDGVRIDPLTRMAAAGGKYEYEIVEPGCCFQVTVELTIRQGHNRQMFHAIWKWLVLQLMGGDLALGAMTGKGLGRCQLINESIHCYHMNNAEEVRRWLKREDSPCAVPQDSEHGFQEKNNYFRIKASFAIKNSLIVRSYSEKPEEPDSVQLRRHIGGPSGKGDAIVPGSSIRGAIRRRAVVILNQLGADGEDMAESLFGRVGVATGAEKVKDTIKGRITIQESVLEPGSYVDGLQHRICIDRFTGSGIRGRLFDSQPVWRSGCKITKMLCINVGIRDYKNWEAGLLLFLLKDLWTADLALGGEKNVGRGTLLGIRAEISLPGEDPIIINQEDDGTLDMTPPGSAAALESLASALTRKVNERQEKDGDDQC